MQDLYDPLLAILLSALAWALLMAFLMRAERDELKARYDRLAKGRELERRAWARQCDYLQERLSHAKLLAEGQGKDATAESEDPADWWKREERTKDQGPRTN